MLELGTSLLSLPTALPLVNGYTGYEQHHSGKADPFPSVVLVCGHHTPLWSLCTCAVWQAATPSHLSFSSRLLPDGDHLLLQREAGGAHHHLVS